MTVAKGLLFVLLLIPAASRADDKPPAPADEKKPIFTLADAEVSKIVRAAAIRRIEGFRVVREESAPAHIPASMVAARFQPLKTSPRANGAVFECRGVAENCAAYDYDGNYLYSAPRHQVYPNPAVSGDDWLACRSRDDMLSTFERFDRCRGIGLLVSTP